MVLICLDCLRAFSFEKFSSAVFVVLISPINQCIAFYKSHRLFLAPLLFFMLTYLSPSLPQLVLITVIPLMWYYLQKFLVLIIGYYFI